MQTNIRWLLQLSAQAVNHFNPHDSADYLVPVQTVAEHLPSPSSIVGSAPKDISKTTIDRCPCLHSQITDIWAEVI